MVVATSSGERVRGDIVRLVHRGLGVRDFAEAATQVLRRVIPFEGMCLLTLDPATLLPTGEVVQNGLPDEARVRLSEIELEEPDFNKFAALARDRRPAASLSEATEGELDRSLRQRELRRPSGFEDELRAVLPGATGTWGAFTLLREAKTPHFTTADVRLVGSLVGPLADGVRRAMLLAAAVADDIEAGLLVLAADNSIEMSNRAADRWLDELGTGDGVPGAPLPLVVRAIASRARQSAAGERAAGHGVDGGVARARVRTPAGRWVIVRGSLLGDGPGSRVAVLLEAVRAPELAPLIADAYDLTERERLVTELVAQGHSTRGIARRLHMSTYTVQDHLKSIFDKSGTGSRGELVARLFFRHYMPRLSAGR